MERRGIIALSIIQKVKARLAIIDPLDVICILILVMHHRPFTFNWSRYSIMIMTQADWGIAITCNKRERKGGTKTEENKKGFTHCKD